MLPKHFLLNTGEKELLVAGGETNIAERSNKYCNVLQTRTSSKKVRMYILLR